MTRKHRRIFVRRDLQGRWLWTCDCCWARNSAHYARWERTWYDAYRLAYGHAVIGHSIEVRR